MIILENQEEPSIKYKTVSRRVFAMLIDLIIYAFFIAVWYIFEDSVYQFNEDWYSKDYYGLYAVYIGLSGLFFALYLTLTQYYFYQTIGDKVVKIKVINLKGGQLKISQLVLRNIVASSYFMILYIAEFEFLLRGFKSSEIDIEHNIYVNVIDIFIMIFIIINSIVMLNSNQRKGLFDTLSKTNMVRA